MELIRKSDALHAVLHNQGDAAVAAVQMIPSAWIKCSERLPEKGIEVLVWSWYTTLTRVWTLDECGEWEDEYGYLQDFEEVTHWMPLPDAPEVEG